jgi:hypothetical protein
MILAMIEWLFNPIQFFKRSKPARLTVAMSDNSEHLRPKSIDEYRHKFLTAPLGYWHQAVGTFGSICDENWEFQFDRTGKVISQSAFSGDRELLFEWREVAELTIACKVTKWPEDLDDTEEVPGEEPEELDEWQTIRYDFRAIPTDVGELIGMYEVNADGTISEGFWLSIVPLSFSRNL